MLKAFSSNVIKPHIALWIFITNFDKICKLLLFIIIIFHTQYQHHFRINIYSVFLYLYNIKYFDFLSSFYLFLNKIRKIVSLMIFYCLLRFYFTFFIYSVSLSLSFSFFVSVSLLFIRIKNYIRLLDTGKRDSFVGGLFNSSSLLIFFFRK